MVDWTEIAVAIATVAVGGTGAVAVRLLAHMLKVKKDKSIEAVALDALLAGMALAQDTIVRQAKVKGGKLSANVIDHAEEVAMDKAKTIATGAALNLLESWGRDAAKSKIKGLLKWGNTAK